MRRLKRARLLLLALLLGSLTPPLFVSGQISLDDVVDYPAKSGVTAALDTKRGALSLSRWNGEATLELKAPLTAPSLATSISSKIELTYDGFKVEVYETPGGIEWDFIIPSYAGSEWFLDVTSLGKLSWY